VAGRGEKRDIDISMNSFLKTVKGIKRKDPLHNLGWLEKKEKKSLMKRSHLIEGDDCRCMSGKG